MKLYESIFTIMEDVRQDIIDEYEGLKIKASGNFEKKMKVGRKGKKVYLRLPYYSQFISIIDGRNPGRGPGGMPSIDVIKKWVKDKGLLLRDALGRFTTKSDANYTRAAKAIRWKIGKEGTDIHQGKREAIDIDKILNDRLDYALNSLANRILEDLK